MPSSFRVPATARGLSLNLCLLLALEACAANAPTALPADPTPEAYAAYFGHGATIVPAGQYALDDRPVACKSLPTVLDPHLNDYAASFPQFIVLRPDMMAKPSTAVKLWIYYHECGHEHLGAEENKADCYSVTRGAREGWLKPDGLDQICNFIAVAQPDAAHPAGPQRCELMRACYAKAVSSGNSRR